MMGCEKNVAVVVLERHMLSLKPRNTILEGIAIGESYIWACK